MFDEFIISSDGINFMRSGKKDWLFEEAPPKDGLPGGTVVNMEIATDARQTAKEIFDAYRAGFDDIGFSKIDGVRRRKTHFSFTS
jgi:hypothetical protein